MAYRSGFEKRLAASLNGRGISFRYEPFSLPYTKPARFNKKLRELHGLPEDFQHWTYHSYTPDFELPSGVLVEAKGKFTAAMRTIVLNVIRCNPEIDLRMCFQRDNRLHSGSKTTYSEWCKRNNIDYAIGTIPTEWTIP